MSPVMPVVDLKLPHHAYQIRIEPGALGRLGSWARELAPHDRAVMIADENVMDPHGQLASTSLRDAGYDLLAHSMAFGEKNKTLATVSQLYDVMINHRAERRSPVIALGGGICGDTAGFVAASYLRGVPFIQCPTTLLAMVDASVGGKVGVNLPAGKNLVGAFYQPQLVVVDTHTLKTLPLRELRCGLAECVKHAVIRDGQLFDWIEQNLESIMGLDDETCADLIERNVNIKARVVMADEKESGVRAHLNFGHTFAHAIESQAGYGRYHHGEAVSLGMVAACRLAAEIGRCESKLTDRLIALLDRIGLPTSAGNLPANEILFEAMKLDKKVSGGNIRMVLPECMGQVSIVGDAPADAIEAAWESLRQ
jgi:3-dehydroquinate synthase